MSFKKLRAFVLSEEETYNRFKTDITFLEISSSVYTLKTANFYLLFFNEFITNILNHKIILTIQK